jgi:hypothetical protein
MALGGVGTGLTMMAAGLAPGADRVSSGMDGRPQIGLTRTPPTAPSNTDIAVWIRRLREGQLPEQREQAAIQLCELNNPKALPHMAAVFIHDDTPKVQQAAQHYGKILYWRAVYWEMEQDGTLAEEMMRRAAAIGKTLKTPKTGAASMGGTLPPPPGASQGQANPAQAAKPEEPPVDVGEILRKAQQAREQRKRRP